MEACSARAAEEDLRHAAVAVGRGRGDEEDLHREVCPSREHGPHCRDLPRPDAASLCRFLDSRPAHTFDSRFRLEQYLFGGPLKGG